MSDKKGFTLIEIIAVMVIIGIMTAIAFPTYVTMLNQGAAKSAQNNLIAIYNGQKTYYLSNGNYYNSGSANDLTNINAALILNITDTNFTYTCATAAGPKYTCTATNISDGNLVLTVTSGTPAAPNPIVLSGGTTCASSTGANPGCNPSCTTDVNAYCPTN
jgi:prepilin-type N-terminal cleavage/methylation domain-containing protein